MPEITPVTYQCRHIQTAGHRCGSPALRNEPFCYFHHTTRKPAFHRHADRQNAELFARHQESLNCFDLPLPDDHAAIQLSIGQILQRLAANTIETKRAGLILYALQIASLNLPKPLKNTTPAPTVQDIEHDCELGTLAPPAEYQSAPREKTLEEILTAQWAQDKIDEEEASAAQAPAPVPLPSPVVLPKLEAFAPATTRSCFTLRTAAIKRTDSRVQTRKPTLRGGLSILCRRSPNLPHTYACSTIGPTRLNFRVRDGNGCDPRGKLTGKLSNFRSRDRSQLNRLGVPRRITYCVSKSL